jgi:hypothetical protein
VATYPKNEPPHAVQRSRDTIGTIAAALAKAQAQLVNPEAPRISSRIKILDLATGACRCNETTISRWLMGDLSLARDLAVPCNCTLPLRTAVSGVIIVAHNEDTTQLRTALLNEGLSVEEVRGPYTQEQLSYSNSMKCLVNEANAWRIVKSRPQPTIVVEADFVPVRGFGTLPAPIPSSRWDTGVAYLYSIGPEIWDLSMAGVARGHSGGCVALLIPPKVAELLLVFFEEQLLLNPLGKYYPWDTRLGYWLKDRGVESYIPYRHYGEHGGIGNPEHAKAGLGRAHRADALYGPLAFMPMYANGSLLRYWRTRLWARLWGIGRLAFGRFLTWHDYARSDRLRMIRFALGRLVFPNPPRCARHRLRHRGRRCRPTKRGR